MDTTAQFVRELICQNVVDVVFIDDLEPLETPFSATASAHDANEMPCAQVSLCTLESHGASAAPLVFARNYDASPDATVCSTASFSPAASSCPACVTPSPEICCPTKAHACVAEDMPSLNLSVDAVARHVVALTLLKDRKSVSQTESRQQTVSLMLQQLLDSGYIDESSVILMLVLFERCAPQSPSFLTWTSLRRAVIAILQLIAKNYGDVYFSLERMSTEAGLRGSCDKLDMTVTCQWKIFAALDFSLHVSAHEFENARQRLCYEA